MAETHDERSSLMSDLEEIKASLRRLENDERPAPLTDPSKNVNDRLDAAVARIDDIRRNDRYWQEKLRESDLSWQAKLDAQKERSDELRFKTEQSRTDALRAGDAAQTASVLTQVTNTAANLATVAAATKDTQDKAIVALQLIASSSGGTLSGREAQQAQARGINQWVVGLLVVIILAGAAIYFKQPTTTPTPIQVTVVAPTPAPTK